MILVFLILLQGVYINPSIHTIVGEDEKVISTNLPNLTKTIIIKYTQITDIPDQSFQYLG